MPRVRGQNISQMIRQGLEQGLPESELISRARAMSPNPMSWNHNSIEWVRRNMQRRQQGGAPVVASDTNLLSRTWGYGVEIECYIQGTQNTLERKLTEAGLNSAFEGYNHNTSNYWKITTDASLETKYSDRNNFNNVEIVSPILFGEAGLAQLKKVCEVVKTMNGKINTKAGLHIHHACKDGHGGLKLAVMAALIYRQYQEDFDKMLPVSRRSCNYAQHLESSDFERYKRFIRADHISDDQMARRRVVNVYAYARHGTCEFRQHSGSVDYTKISNWIKITRHVMIQAKKAINELTVENMFGWRKQNDFFEYFKFEDETKTYITQRREHFLTAVA
jgi:hypothetical protein